MRVSQSGVMTFRFAGQMLIDAIKTPFAVSDHIGILHNLMQMQQKLQRYAMKAQ